MELKLVVASNLLLCNHCGLFYPSSGSSCGWLTDGVERQVKAEFTDHFYVASGKKVILVDLNFSLFECSCFV